MMAWSQNVVAEWSAAISLLSLFISFTTAWLTLVRKGDVKMVRPSIIYIGPDGGNRDIHAPKVYLRFLLFCTAKRGRIIEAMFVSLSRNESKQNFSVWVLGDDRLSRGSGLFVGDQGLLANHHFLTPRDSNLFAFQEGSYKLKVFARLLGDKRDIELFSQDLDVTSVAAKMISEKKKGLIFDWGPDAGKYLPHIEESLNTAPMKHTPMDIDWERAIGSDLRD